MKKIELNSPASTPEKIKTAIFYGADSIYFGASSFDLRARSEKISLEYIDKSLNDIHSANKKAYLVFNSYIEEERIDIAKKELKVLLDYDFDAVIISELGLIDLIKSAGKRVFLSTQVNILNSLTINFYKNIGIDRIIAARELSLYELHNIKKNTDIEIETFIHGAMCIAYSGRCLLSRYFTLRDANKGLCTHPCRWKYVLQEREDKNKRIELIEGDGYTEILAATDMSMAPYIQYLFQASIDAVKIEGRMKSAYYIANLTRVYRTLIDLWYRTFNNIPSEEIASILTENMKILKKITGEKRNHKVLLENLLNNISKILCNKDMELYKLAIREAELVSHRPYSTGFYFGRDDYYYNEGYIQKKDFIAQILYISEDKEREIINALNNTLISVKYNLKKYKGGLILRDIASSAEFYLLYADTYNRFAGNTNLEAILPGLKNIGIYIKDIISEKFTIEEKNIAGRRYFLLSNTFLEPYTIIRRGKNG